MMPRRSRRPLALVTAALVATACSRDRASAARAAGFDVRAPRGSEAPRAAVRTESRELTAAPQAPGDEAPAASAPPGATRVQTPTGPIVLPRPFATPSADNGPRVVARPAGAALSAPAGFTVTEFAAGLVGPRWIAVAPNGDVFVTENRRSRVVVLRDADRDGRAEQRSVFATGLDLPFGLAFHPAGWLYVANTSSVVRFRYAPGQLVASGRPERITELPGRGYNQHWTRNVVVSPDARTLFITVGSETNVDPERDPRRGAVSACDPDGAHFRVFAGGLRNPVGLAFHPRTGALFAVVNERDELGDDLVPDYLTQVREGAFYGWPYAYFGPNEDPRRRGERPDLVARTVVPDLSLGAHTAALGLAFYTGAMFPQEYQGDAFVSLHGSWNRSAPAGYKVVRVRFGANGRPTGEVEDFVTGFRTERGAVWGRPVGLAVASDGALLVVDDAADRVWRVARGG